MRFDSLPTDWDEATVADVAADGGLVGGPFGSSLGRKDYVDHGIPVIRGANIRGPGRFDAAELTYVTEEKVKQDLRRNTAVPGDIVLTQRGTLGQVGVVPQGDHPLWVISQSQERLRVEPTKADRDFVYFALRSPAMKDAILRRAITTGVPHINLGITAELPLPLPSLDEQQRIARVLNALDSKIENNTRIAGTLEQVGATLFTARFVDFVDHDDLVESEIGPIPRGWNVVPVSDLARYVNGKAFTKYGNGRGRMVIRIAELRSGPSGSTVYTDHETESDFMACPGDILFAWSGSLDVYRWHRDEALINQHIFKVIPEGYPAWFVYFALKHVMPHFQAIAADKATTMGHIKRSHLGEYFVAAPPPDDVRGDDRVFRPLFDRCLGTRIENEILTAVRDTLLPKLVSGQIRVPADAFEDAETA